MNLLIGTSVSGLADRLNTLVAVRHLAQITGREFAFEWTANDQCGLTLDALNAMLDVGGRWWVCEPKVPMIDFGAVEVGAVEAFIRALTSRTPKLKLHLFAPPGTCKLGRDIKFTETTYALAKSFVRPNMIGVHIRAGDKVHHEVPVVLPMEIWFDAVDWQECLRPIFLASDSIAIKRAFVERYGARVSFSALGSHRDTSAGVSDAIIDLCVLSQCSTLVLSEYSMFSQLLAVAGRRVVFNPRVSKKLLGVYQ